MLLPVDCVLRAQSTFCWDDSRINCKFSVSLPQTNSNICLLPRESTVVEFGVGVIKYKIGLDIRSDLLSIRWFDTRQARIPKVDKVLVSTVVEHGTGTL